MELKPIKQMRLALKIIGISPMVQHQWDEKSKKMMRDKHAGKKTKVRDVREPEAEFIAATYVTEEGKFGIPAQGLKKALITAAHKDIGIEKTLLRKSLFIECDDPGNIIEMECSEPLMREDVVRVGMGSSDLRYRPEFRDWSVGVTLQFDAEALTVENIVNLFQRAGFGVGIGEMRPEKDGENGRFKVDTSQPMQATEIEI